MQHPKLQSREHCEPLTFLSPVTGVPVHHGNWVKDIIQMDEDKVVEDTGLMVNHDSSFVIMVLRKLFSPFCFLGKNGIMIVSSLQLFSLSRVLESSPHSIPGICQVKSKSPCLVSHHSLANLYITKKTISW